MVVSKTAELQNLPTSLQLVKKPVPVDYLLQAMLCRSRLVADDFITESGLQRRQSAAPTITKNDQRLNFFCMSVTVLPAYGLMEKEPALEPFGSGLINHTWRVSTTDRQYILQRVNEAVFRKPEDIAYNIRLIGDHLAEHHPDYAFVSPLAAADGRQLVYCEGEGFYRLFPFVVGSHSKDVVENAEQAYEAAVQFGRFTRLLAGFDASQLRVTITGFHNLTWRYQQFASAVENGNKTRLHQVKDDVDFLISQYSIVQEYERLTTGGHLKLRVTHHDTKISNVLFDKKDKGLCVIDLDTVMPGYFISDVGDMMRTYLSPVSEEESDYSKIEVREAFYRAIVQGYYSEMKDELTPAERDCFFFAGKMMVYMQALRFLADYLNDDAYYGAAYPEHNRVRAGNQITLLQCLLQKAPLLEGIGLQPV